MEISVLGIDLAKKVFQLHGIGAEGKEVFRKKLSRSELLRTIVKLKPCLIAMEACGSSHYWGREFRKYGHQVKLIPAQYVKPFVRTNKNDANDAEAIVEAALRPNIRALPIKEMEHQDMQCLHRARERLIKQKVALINQIRGFFQEYGVLTPDSRHKIISGLVELIEKSENKLSPLIREVLLELREELKLVMERIESVENKIFRVFRQNDVCKLLESIPGVGLLTATAVYAAVPDPNHFKNGRHFSASIGLVPRQYSSGGKSNLLGISKRGDRYLRKLLVHGARTRVSIPSRKSEWLAGVEKRRGRNKAVVAQANKTARIIWSVMSKKQAYQDVRAA